MTSPTKHPKSGVYRIRLGNCELTVPMMRTALYLAIAAAVALPSASRAEPSAYLCVADYTIGYAFQGGR